MDEILLTDRLIRRGFSHDELTRLRRSGDLHRVRRGAYVASLSEEQTATERHHQMIKATAPQLRVGAVVSHVSAAVLHGLPLWEAGLDRVHLTRPRHGGGGKTRSLVRIHTSPLEPADITEIAGIPVTSLERTVFDLARTLPFDQAVAAGDRALALEMALDILAEMLERGENWQGIRQARRVAGFIDARAESPGESVSRVRCLELNLPAPELQVPVHDEAGVLVARCDFGWDEQRTLGEFDGKIKYGRLLQPGETVSDVVYREKRREDLLRDLGWQVVRWVWAELYHAGVIKERLERAFARGRRTVIL